MPAAGHDLLIMGDRFAVASRRVGLVALGKRLIRGPGRSGEQEQQSNSVVVKNMMTGQQEQILQTQVVPYLRK